MEYANLLEAEQEAHRFLKKVSDLKTAFKDDGRTTGTMYGYPSENGAVKRASMDLSRALSKLRNQ